VSCWQTRLNPSRCSLECGVNNVQLLTGEASDLAEYQDASRESGQSNISTQPASMSCSFRAMRQLQTFNANERERY